MATRQHTPTSTLRLTRPHPARISPPVALWLVLRLAKLIGVIAFAMGIALALGQGPQQVRQRAAYWLATPGFIVTWIAGWGMARMYAISLGRPWITISMVASLIALHEIIREVEPGRPRSKVRVAVILIALLVALASMVIRHG
ncbi:MAG TPA: hypothetical protein VK034_14230 [Enhygromyxa sp.]|nr:hypothetical protein [Enhygromyxa sp.]